MANISFIKDVKSLKINEEPSHEYELGSDLMRVGGVRQVPRLNNVPAFRDNGYQLDFTVATGGNINFNGTDYPQSTLITSFEAEGKTWLFNEFSSNIIESETGDLATVSVNEGDSFLDSDVWQKKPFALEFDPNNSEFLDLESTKSLVNDGDYIHVKGIITQPLPLTNNPYLFRNETPLDYLRLLNNGDIRLEYNNGSASVWSNMYSSDVIDLRLEIASSGGIWRITTPESVSSKTRVANVPFTIDTFFRGGGVFTGFELYFLDINGETFNLTEGLGNEVIGSSGTVGTMKTSHVDGLRRINYGMWQKGNDTDGWTPYD